MRASMDAHNREVRLSRRRLLFGVQATEVGEVSSLPASMKPVLTMVQCVWSWQYSMPFRRDTHGRE